MQRPVTQKSFLFLILVALFTMSFIPVALAQPSDIQGHWAEPEITAWFDKGLTNGYSDGTFKPDNTITRAEFAAMANRAFNFSGIGTTTFSDVSPNSWYAKDVSIASAAGYISGYGDGTFRPDSKITRQEAAAMIARILKLDTSDLAKADIFSDASQIQQWSKGAIGAVYKKGIMSGYQDKSFRPGNPITRAEAVVTIDRAMAGGADNAGGTDNETPVDDPAETETETPSTGGGGGGSSSIPVRAITVTGTDGATSVVNGGNLQMVAAVTPTYARNKTIAWTVEPGTGTAVISAEGLLTGTGSGTVTVTAANAASGVTGSVEITVITVDKMALRAAITAEVGADYASPVWVLTQEDYTAATWTPYANTIMAAIAVESNVNAVQSAVDAAVTPIGTTKAALVLAADKMGLTEAINAEYSDGAPRTTLILVQGDYTANSWTAYTGAITAAIGVEADPNAIQTEANEAEAGIGTAEGALEFAGQADIETALADAAALTEVDYTTGSWAVLETALAMTGDTNTQVVAKTTAVNDAIDALVFAGQAALDTAKTAAAALTETDYTPASWSDLTDALALSETTNAQVVAKTSAINNAIDALTTPADKTVLTAAITAEVGTDHASLGYVLTQGDYTETTWTAYANAITAAIAVEGDVNAVQSAADTAVTTLSTTKAGLVFAGQADLDTALADAAALTEVDYTTGSWAVLETALAMTGNTNTQVVAKTTAINDAITALVFAGQADLNTAKAAAAALTQTDYTPASWSDLTDALALPETTNAQVVAKTAAINDAIDALTTPADKTGLSAAINAEYSDGAARTTLVLAEGNYTAESWAAYTGAITAAEGIEVDPNATQTAVDDAEEAIGTTEGALVFANQATMVAAKAEAQAKVQSGYTAPSWSLFTAAKTTALALPETTNTEMGDKTIALNNAMALLIEMPVMSGTVTVTGTAKFGEILTANADGITYTPGTVADVPTYQWMRDGVDISGATGTTYTLVVEDIGAGIIVIVTADGDNATGSVTSGPTTTVEKADGPAAPAAPTEASKTHNSITLTANDLHEFSIDNGTNWQDSPEFTELDPENPYTFVARFEETNTQKASTASAGTIITTNQALVTGITVSGADAITTVVIGNTLQMSAAVEPEDATDGSVTWSVVSGSGNATIGTDGLLTGTQVGSVTVKATANDASGIFDTLQITIAESYSIGDTGPSGGLVFYDKGNYSDGWQYLEAATVAQDQVNHSWELKYMAWSNVTGTIVGTNTAVGTGQANTDTIIGQTGHSKSAAKICADFNYYNMDQIKNYNDWFLPSKDELDLIYSNLYLGSHASEFDPTAFYWSSSEINASDAYGLICDEAFHYQNWFYKYYSSGYVRPVRTF